jgi:ABC-2 type transport system ATP-binding protein
MEEANQLCHRIAVINHGKIATVDSPENLKAKSMELQYIEVVFDKLVDLQDFSDNPDIVKISHLGNRLRVYTANPPAVVEFLVDFAKHNRLKILSINTMMPSLEDVFLKLIRGEGAVVK